MDNFNLTIRERENLLELSAEFGNMAIGNQYDNKAQMLTFTRPEGRESENLRLIFSDYTKTFAALDLGTKNSFIIPNALTQKNYINLQIAFTCEGAAEHSNMLSLSLRESVPPANAEITAWAGAGSEILDSAFTSADFSEGILTFSNLGGSAVDSAELTFSAENIGYSNNNLPGAENVGAAISALDTQIAAIAEAVGDTSAIAGHNTATDSHADIRTAISGKASASDVATAISAHDSAEAAHEDIRTEIAAIAEAVGDASAISAHDSAEASHEDIRTAISTKPSASDVATAISAHDSAESSHEDIRTEIAAIAEAVGDTSAIAGHNTATDSHADIRTALAAKPSASDVATAISAHDTATDSHADIRTAISAKPSASDVATAISAHDSAEAAHEDIRAEIAVHAEAAFNSENGVHNLRYYENKLEFWDGEDWVTIQTSGGGDDDDDDSDDDRGDEDSGDEIVFAPEAAIAPGITPRNGGVTITWGDPGDTIIDGETVAVWSGTKLVQKIGSYPADPQDGTLIVDNQELNAYKYNGYVISGLTNNTEYFYALFPYNIDGAVNYSEDNRLKATPKPYRVMTAKIDLTKSDPEAAVSYADDALTVSAGDAAWDDFFGFYPCLLSEGEEVWRINPQNFSQFIDGTAIDNVSGAAGDVMIAFPRRGIQMSKANSIVTVSMTDEPNNADFTYFAHQRGTVSKNTFYRGAYKGTVMSSKLRSLSQNTVTASNTIAQFRAYARANGTGYDQTGFYQLTFCQCMYLLKYKNLNSQTTFAPGYTSGSGPLATGSTDTAGLHYAGETSTDRMKLFGLEDFWGNTDEFIEGIYITNLRHTLLTTTAFAATGSGYTDNGVLCTSNFSSYLTVPVGTSAAGFLGSTGNGSATTYFCDAAGHGVSSISKFGGNYSSGDGAGCFALDSRVTESYTNATAGARLMFL